MRSSSLMAVTLLLDACVPAPKVLSQDSELAKHIVGEGREFARLCAGNENGYEDLARERPRYLLNQRIIRVLEDDLSKWECTPVLGGGGVLTSLETRFRDSNGTVWVVDMAPNTDSKEDLSASLK